MRLAGLADLCDWSASICGKTGERPPYFSTAAMLWQSTAANSLTRCGLFPVLSSCRMVPITTSSFMPSVSILCTVAVPGDGGGVCSASRDGGSALMRTFIEAGGLMEEGGGVVEPCDHFGFFDRRSSSSTVAGGDGRVIEAALARLGIWMPRSATENDFFLVL